MNLAALSPHLREAAERFEHETGRRFEETLGDGTVSEFEVGLYLILNGYSPDDLRPVPASPLSE